MSVLKVLQHKWNRWMTKRKTNKQNRFLSANRVVYENGCVVFTPPLYINNRGTICFRGKCWCNSFPNGSPFQVALSTYNKDARIEIGNNCKLNGCMLHANELIKLGDDCRIGPGTILCDNDSHKVALSVEGRAGVPDAAPVVLEDNVWIGMNCIILKGVHIEKNTIIAAGSVVTKDCIANSIYGGNPAKWIKYIE